MKKISTAILTLALVWPASGQAPKEVDFRYAPDWHATSICLPDDTCKTLVGPQGQLLYDFGERENSSLTQTAWDSRPYFTCWPMRE